MPDIESRVSRLEDRAALQDLVVRYFLACDDDDLAAVGDAFATNGSFSISGFTGGTSREAVVAFLADQRSRMGLTVHTPNYALFTFTGPASARGLVGAHLELVFGDDAVFGAVRYADEYVREADGWRILSRDMRTTYMAPWSEVGSTFASPLPVAWPGFDPLVSDHPRKGGLCT